MNHEPGRWNFWPFRKLFGESSSSEPAGLGKLPNFRLMCVCVRVTTPPLHLLLLFHLTEPSENVHPNHFARSLINRFRVTQVSHSSKLRHLRMRQQTSSCLAYFPSAKKEKVQFPIHKNWSSTLFAKIDFSRGSQRVCCCYQRIWCLRGQHIEHTCLSISAAVLEGFMCSEAISIHNFT